MKLQELPSPYRELAEMRREQSKCSNYTNHWSVAFGKTKRLQYAFEWDKTPEGHNLWDKVDDGLLPEIPASSLAELAEWQKSKGEKVEPTPEPILIGGKTDTEWLYLFAGQAMQGFMASYAGATQDPKVDVVADKSIEYAKALLTQLKKEAI